MKIEKNEYDDLPDRILDYGLDNFYSEAITKMYLDVFSNNPKKITAISYESNGYVCNVVLKQNNYISFCNMAIAHLEGKEYYEICQIATTIIEKTKNQK